MNCWKPMLAMCGLLVAAPGTLHGQDAGTERYTPPTRLKTDQKQLGNLYPYGAVRDALVFVRFNITANGDVVDAEVEEGGFHTAEFERAALRIATAMKYTPATRNGVPVESTGMRMPVRFQMASQQGGGPIRGVTQEFRNEALKVQKLIEAKDFTAAEHHANYMMAEKVALFYEFSVLQATLADSYARTGQYHLALAALREITRRTGMDIDRFTPGGALPRVSERDYLLPPESIGHMLKLRFVIDDSLGFYWDAVNAHAELQALGQVAADDPTMKRFHELENLVQTAPALKAHVRMGQNPWGHELLFRRFTVTNVRGGTLKAIMLGCAGSARRIDYQPDVEWQVPDRFGRCAITFLADPGAEFDVIEFRDAAASPATSPAASQPAAAN